MLQNYINQYDVVTLYPNIIQFVNGYEQKKYTENDINKIKDKISSHFKINGVQLLCTESYFRNMAVINAFGNITKVKKIESYEIIENNLLLLTKLEKLDDGQIPSINPDFERKISITSFLLEGIDVFIEQENNVYSIAISIKNNYSENILKTVLTLVNIL
jgi:hypothetical protein